MSLLHKLMERKDLKNYLDLRIKQLNYNMRDLPDDVEEKKLHVIVERLKARRKELEKLRHHLTQREIKDKSKNIWQFLRERGKVDYEEEPEVKIKGGEK